MRKCLFPYYIVSGNYNNWAWRHAAPTDKIRSLYLTSACFHYITGELVITAEHKEITQGQISGYLHFTPFLWEALQWMHYMWWFYSLSCIPTFACTVLTDVIH